MTPLDYMRKYGAFEVEQAVYNQDLNHISDADLQDTKTDENGNVLKGGKVVGVMIDGKARAGFNTPSRKQEFFSTTTRDWGWSEYSVPTYVKSHIHPENLDASKNEIVLVPTFRLPTLIHTRSGNAKWLAEISNRNPLWMSTKDGARWGHQNRRSGARFDRYRLFRQSRVGDGRGLVLASSPARITSVAGDGIRTRKTIAGQPIR